MLACLVLLVALVNSGATSPGVEVDDLTGKQFEAALETEDNLAVYWCKYFKALPSFFTITPLYLNMDYSKCNHLSSRIVEVFLVSAVHSYHPTLSPNREVPRIDNFPPYVFLYMLSGYSPNSSLTCSYYQRASSSLNPTRAE